MGRRALLVTGASPERAAPLRGRSEVRRRRLPSRCRWRASPPFRSSGTAPNWRARERCDLVIAMGGGSAIDAGKALAAMLANPGDPLDYLEVIGRGRPLAHPSAPFIAIPTTAGTGLGSHAQRRAGLPRAPRQGQPAQRRRCCRALAVVDPELTLRPAAGRHRLHRPGRPHATDRAVRVAPAPIP